MLKRRTHNKNFVRVARARFWDGSFGLIVLVLLSSFLMVFSGFYPQATDSLRLKAVDVLTPAVERVSVPFQNAVSMVRNVTGLTDIQARMQALEAENKRLRDWYQLAQTLESENASLKELLNVKAEPSRRYVTARVLSDAGMTFVKSMVINVGESESIAKNNAVLSGQGVIGRVIEAGAHSSRVLLVTDVNSRIPVFLEGMEQHAILAGENTPRPALDHIDSGLNIAEGTRVITSGFGGVFPPGLPVGVVKHKDSGYVVDLYSDFGKLRYVRIVSEARDMNLKKASETGGP